MKASPSAEHMKRQRGSFVPGLVVGLLVGLAIALGVALYVTKVPVPFVNKVPQRTADQDAAEAQRNRNWDPNAPLAGRTPARPGDAASTGAVTPPVAPPPGVILPPPPEAVLPSPPTATAIPPKPPVGAEPFTYFVQAGAFGRVEEAEQQRARLAMMDLEARVTEREQAGRMVYRVRVGPFDRKAAAESTKTRLELEGIDATLVPVKN
ncbi:MAG: SPOR domain-containing protein [Pseudomonadota bacterium]